ncbi:MAG: hypothetical protein K1X94_14965 [Sandaracinaceae bacterium]|jgi:hypothetical protein|nr:hypothetical protein [Sandaracinaceae bacterium]
MDDDTKDQNHPRDTTDEAGNDVPAWTLAYTAALYATGLVGLVVPPVLLGTAGLLLGGATVAAVRKKWRLTSALSEERLVRSLRKQRAVEGLAVPLASVLSQEGPCLAFDHVVHRCEACACTRPCSRAGGRYRAEDRGTGRFLVRGAHEALYVDGTDVHFESSLGERAGSHFHRLDAGERVRVSGELVELSQDDVPDDVRATLASLRDTPRLLVPREGSSILVAASRA